MNPNDLAHETSEVPDDATVAADRGSLLLLAFIALVAGAISGGVCAVFRLTLVQADGWRDSLLTWAHVRDRDGLLIVAGVCGMATALAAWLVRRISPEASGSGIPHVEAVLAGRLAPAPIQLIPVKFLGGLLSIGAGLALGREGPSVQMGASLAHRVGHILGLGGSDGRILLAAGAGAGLATAFNAPIAGAIFVLEELARRFDTRMTIATCAASASAIGVARVLLGTQPDFDVAPLAHPALQALPLFLVLGTALGFLGVLYNGLILGALEVARRMEPWPVELRAALVGTGVGLLAWHLPTWVGGGDQLTQAALNGTMAVTVVPLLLLVRFLLGPISYAAGTPGGLFAPLLVLGAQAGRLSGTYLDRWLPQAPVDPCAFAVAGMAAFFAAVVRAPLTGIILVIELTASYTQLLPMLAACAAAMLVPTLLGNEPIYEALRVPVGSVSREAKGTKSRSLESFPGRRSGS